MRTRTLSTWMGETHELKPKLVPCVEFGNPKIARKAVNAYQTQEVVLLILLPQVVCAGGTGSRSVVEVWEGGDFGRVSHVRLKQTRHSSTRSSKRAEAQRYQSGRLQERQGLGDIVHRVSSHETTHYHAGRMLGGVPTIDSPRYIVASLLDHRYPVVEETRNQIPGLAYG